MINVPTATIGLPRLSSHDISYAFQISAPYHVAGKVSALRFSARGRANRSSGSYRSGYVMSRPSGALFSKSDITNQEGLEEGVRRTGTIVLERCRFHIVERNIHTMEWC